MAASNTSQKSPQDKAIEDLQAEQRTLRADIKQRGEKAKEQGDDTFLMTLVAGAAFAADFAICGGLFSVLVASSGGGYLWNKHKQAKANKRIARIDFEIETVNREKLRLQAEKDLADVLKAGGQPLQDDFNQATQQKIKDLEEQLRQAREAGAQRRLDNPSSPSV